MAFKIQQQIVSNYADPETLFADIKQKKIQGLLSHQADIIRNFVREGLSTPDVAIQLATGTGKTLIGLLIGEWLRLKNKERVVYLCPTNQLVHQVANQATEHYGIDCCAFVGKKNDYSAELKDNYHSAGKIAITSYSSLFNSKPFFNNPNVIILDDVHQAENYINSLWSMRLKRNEREHRVPYEELLSIIKPCISQTEFKQIVNNQEFDQTIVNKLPTVDFQKFLSSIIFLLDEKLPKTDQNYSWRMIRNNINSCHLYYTPREILIKPLYPPTFSFKPFTDARQRIYMSATFGNSGELERIVGRSQIQKLEIPEQWKNRCVGRRFFCFPETSLDHEDINTFIQRALPTTPRKVYIAPSTRKINEVEESLSNIPGITFIHASDIEETKDSFLIGENSLLLLASRYDGIDFPDNECRLLIIDGLPKALNIQERFLINTLGQTPAFISKIITRITQAFGRTTRSSTDFSVVIVVGEEILRFLQSPQNRSFLLPELNAEIDFGLEQSRQTEIDNILDNIEIFLRQGNDWKNVDTIIIEKRNSLSKNDLPNSDLLLNIVHHEIKYNEAVWNNDFAAALNECKSILGNVKKPELRGLRGFWNYLAGTATFFLETQGIKVDISAETYFEYASKAAPAISWLHRIKHTISTPEEKNETNALFLIDRIEREIPRMGTANSFKIDNLINTIRSHIAEDESQSFEKGQVLLGQFLGYDSGKVESDGSPDPWWKVNEQLCFVFEDYTDGNENSKLNIKKARQASSHVNWIRANVDLDKDAEIYVIIVGKISKVASEAVIHLDNVSFIHSDEFRRAADQAIHTVRDLWSSFPGEGDLFWREKAVDRFKDLLFSPVNLIHFHKENKCEKVLEKI